MIGHLVVLTLLNYLFVKKFFPDWKKDKGDCKDYRFQVGEMAIQNFLSIPNLRDTKAARFCRKFSFYASLIFNITLILILLLLRHRGIEHAHYCLIFTCEEDKDIYCDDHHHNYFNEVVYLIIFIGLFGLVLDLIYARSSAAVFNIPVVNRAAWSENISRILSGAQKYQG